MNNRSAFSFLWNVIKPYKFQYAVMLSAPILGAFYEFGNQYALKLIVDAFTLTDHVSYEAIFWPIALFVSAQILVDVVWRVADIAEWKSEPYVRRNILHTVVSYVQKHPYSFFQNTPSGSITSRIKGILDGYDNFWAAMHHDFTPKIAGAIILTAVLSVVSIKVCLLVFVWAVVFFLVMFWFSKKLDHLSFVYANSRHKVLGLITDTMSNILTVLSFATRNQELANQDNLIDKELTPANINVYKLSFLSNIVAAVFHWAMLIALFLYMVHLRQTNQATTGDVVFVIGITLKMSFELWHLIQRMQTFMKNIGDLKSAFTIMTLPHDPRDIAPQKPILVRDGSIKFDHICFKYPNGNTVFNGLSLRIKAGEKVGLVGISGAGKSTMVSLLLKYFHPERGAIYIDDQNISEYSADSIRQNIAVIPQDIMLFHRSIKENIAYGSLNSSHNNIMNAAKMANIHTFISDLPDGYDTMVGERGLKLSGGQRQRIAIARAFLKHAPILILDEATSSLDASTESLIQQSLLSILHNKETTVVAIAHRLATIKNMDRLIVLEHGTIVEEGSHEELIKSGKLYKRLWEMQKI